MLLEIKFLAVPSEESNLALLKSKMDLRSGVKFLLGTIGVISFLFITCFIFFKPLNMINPIMLLIGIISILIGRGITFKGSLDIRNHMVQKGERLLDNGIFSYTRNPILLGLNISLLGFLIALGIYQLVFLSLIFYIGMHIKVLDEEKFLFQKYGLTYKNYKNNTRRYL